MHQVLAGSVLSIRITKNILWLGLCIGFTCIIYHVRRILKRLQVALPHEADFNAANSPYTNEEFFTICEDYGVSHDSVRYKDEKFYWTYQRGVGWPDDYIGPDSMTRWIIEKSQGFTDVELLKISESVKANAYLILSSQAFCEI